jgi:chromosome segregation ATPase
MTIKSRSKESAINEAITEIKSRCVHLTQANDTYEKLIKENEDLIKMLKEEVSAVKIRCLRLTMDNEKLSSALKLKTDDMKSLNDTITSLADENSKLQGKFQDLTNENKTLLDSLQQRIDQVAQLKCDLESVKMVSSFYLISIHYSLIIKLASFAMINQILNKKKTQLAR